MKVIPFAFYYLKLQFTIAFGLHHTSHPLDLRWRWSFWQRREESKRRRHF
jgi:hypothetical protein